MIFIELGKGIDGMMTFRSNNGGRMMDITKEERAKLINKKMLIKNGREIKKNIYIAYNPLIMALTKQEDKTIDCLYINYKGRHIIIVGSNTEYFVKWN